MVKYCLFFLFTLLLIGIFSFFPAIDLTVSSLFYQEPQGFIYKNILFCKIVKEFVPVFIPILIVTLFSLLLYYSMSSSIANITKKKNLLYLLLSLAIGPGLIVNGIFKEHWGRARPTQIKEFGGSHIYTPPLMPTFYCKKNCSFVSGHASVGFYLISFGLVSSSPRRKKFFIALSLFMGGLIGFVRIVQGGHFLSDVLFSGLVTYLVAWMLASVMFKKI